jgi:hypothetical protein
MSNLADLDLLVSLPCRHCARLLHGHVKFCPYCGAEEESATLGDEPSASAAFEAERAAPEPAEPPAPVAMETAIRPRDEVPERIELPDTAGVLSESREDLDFKIASIVPAAFERIEELPPSTITVPARTLAPHRGPIRKYLMIGATLAFCAFALVLGYVRFNGSNEPDRSRELTAKLAQVQSALSRGDFSAAESELAALAAAYPDHAGVRALSGELDQRTRERSARREQLREAALKASKALGLGEPDHPPSAPPSAPSLAEAPPAATAPVVVPPAPETGVKSPKDNECNEALAALALCQRGEAR